LQDALAPVITGNIPVDLREDGKWLWTAFSVWGVSAVKLKHCLQIVSAPTILVTSEDGCRWHLKIFRGSEQLVSLCHEFRYLSATESIDEDFEEETLEDDLVVAGVARFDNDFDQLTFLWDEEEAARIVAEEKNEIAGFVAGQQIIKEQTELGMRLPDGLSQKLRSKTSPQKACWLLLEWQCKTIDDTLSQLGVSFDQERLAACFDPAVFSDEEADSDLGNMPRLVQTLGMTSAFAKVSGGSGDQLPEDSDIPELDDQQQNCQFDNKQEFQDDEWDEDDDPEDDAKQQDTEDSDEMQIIETVMESMNALAEVIAGGNDSGTELVRGKRLAADGQLEVFAADAQQLVAGHQESEQITEAIRELEKIDFGHVGNIICPALGRIVCLCFAGPKDCHAHILIDTYCGREFWTKFENGDVLTTNKEDNMGEISPEDGLYFLSYDDISMVDLLQKHRLAIEKFDDTNRQSPFRIKRR